jgi:hypothetical protein
MENISLILLKTIIGLMCIVLCGAIEYLIYLILKKPDDGFAYFLGVQFFLIFLCGAILYLCYLVGDVFILL